MKQMTYAEAIRDGMRVEMLRDPNVYLQGEDVAQFGGCFGLLPDYMTNWDLNGL